MRTDDLIVALSRDTVVEPPVPALRAAVLALITALVAGAVFVLALGARHDLADSLLPVALKLVVTGLAALAGLLLLARGTWYPGQNGPSHASTPLALATGVLAGWFMIVLWKSPASLTTGVIGPNAWHCLVAIPLISLPTLAILVAAARRSAITRPDMAAAAAGLVAAGLAACAYAFFCIEDSPLFVAIWYGIAFLAVQGLSKIAFRRFVRW